MRNWVFVGLEKKFPRQQEVGSIYLVIVLNLPAEILLWICKRSRHMLLLLCCGYALAPWCIYPSSISDLHYLHFYRRLSWSSIQLRTSLTEHARSLQARVIGIPFLSFFSFLLKIDLTYNTSTSWPQFSLPSLFSASTPTLFLPPFPLQKRADLTGDNSQIQKIKCNKSRQKPSHPSWTGQPNMWKRVSSTGKNQEHTHPDS